MKKIVLVLTIATALIIGFNLSTSTTLADDPPIWDSCTNPPPDSACEITP